MLNLNVSKLNDFSHFLQKNKDRYFLPNYFKLSRQKIKEISKKCRHKTTNRIANLLGI
jgi:hypothetical protein